MKLYEIFGDWILTWPIVEQARSRDALENRIVDDGYQIVTHLVKIYSWNNPQDFANHIKDINGWIGPIYRLKLKGNKYPKAKDYYNWLMECTDDKASFVTEINRIIDYDVPRSDKSDEEVFEIIKKIIKNISEDMANRKFTHAKDYMI